MAPPSLMEDAMQAKVGDRDFSPRVLNGVWQILYFLVLHRAVFLSTAYLTFAQVQRLLVSGGYCRWTVGWDYQPILLWQLWPLPEPPDWVLCWRFLCTKFKVWLKTKLYPQEEAAAWSASACTGHSLCGVTLQTSSTLLFSMSLPKQLPNFNPKPHVPVTISIVFFSSAARVGWCIYEHVYDSKHETVWRRTAVLIWIILNLNVRTD